MSPYDPESHFSRSALSRLEAAGIPVVTSLAKVPEKLAETIGVLRNSATDNIVQQWISGKSSRPPTWRSLYDVLMELDLEEIGQEIKEYLASELLFNLAKVRNSQRWLG